MKLESKVPCIPKQGVMSFEDWLAGRRARRESGNLVAPEVIRRKASSSDPPWTKHSEVARRSSIISWRILIGAAVASSKGEDLIDT